ncbi:MAG TPA: hypothetical protein VFY79_14170 [Dehalococcoidia bacterium]|jgi:hypothetical protein|nr:hypothetical protein [Dehalococcoidia bacterium]
MTTKTLIEPIPQTDIHALLRLGERLTADEIARRMGVPLDVAWDALRIAVDAGYLDRDEFGTYAAWCVWPRAGL